MYVCVWGENVLTTNFLILLPVKIPSSGLRMVPKTQLGIFVVLAVGILGIKKPRPTCAERGIFLVVRTNLDCYLFFTRLN